VYWQVGRALRARLAVLLPQQLQDDPLAAQLAVHPGQVDGGALAGAVAGHRRNAISASSSADTAA